MPGDPPKTIAWKVSARRDRLITKEFESEVPVRCTLFVDTSHSVRVRPPGKNALTRLVEIAAAVAQASTGVRDLAGLCLFDEHGVSTYLRPARSQRHLNAMLNILADAAFFHDGPRPVTQLRLRADGVFHYDFPDKSEFYLPRADGKGKFMPSPPGTPGGPAPVTTPVPCGAAPPAFTRR